MIRLIGALVASVLLVALTPAVCGSAVTGGSGSGAFNPAARIDQSQVDDRTGDHGQLETLFIEAVLSR